MKAKQRRDLPFDHYQIVETFATEEPETICSNCGKPIKNIAVIQNPKGIKYYVGLDCAETLSGITDEDIVIAESNFANARRIDAKVKKACKNKEWYLFIRNYCGDKPNCVHISVAKKENPKMLGDYYMDEVVSKDFIIKYLPQYAKQAQVNFDYTPIKRDVIIMDKQDVYYEDFHLIGEFPCSKYGDVYSKVTLLKGKDEIVDTNGGRNMDALNSLAVSLINEYKFNSNMKLLINK